MKASPREPIRYRRLSLLAAMQVIALGLASRSEDVGLPWWLAKYLGDGLWGLVVVVGFGFLLSRLSTASVAACSVVFAVAVEVSQLFHPPWLDAIRSTRLGGLAIGTPSATFAWGDIAAYFVGIGCGVVVEWAIFSFRRSRHA